MLDIYFCGSEHCAPGHFFGPAIRPHYLLHIVQEGRGVFKNNKHTYSLKAGDAFLISPLESTYYEADGLDPWTYIWIGFDGQDTADILSRTCFCHSCIYSCPDDASLPPLLKQHAQEVLDTFLNPEHSTLHLLGRFLELLGFMQGRREARPEEVTRQYLRRAMEYMHNNYSYRIKIGDIAASIGIDRTYLYRIFMEEEQVSPKQYLLRLRLRTAANMLRSPQYTVTEIAYSCGFQDTAAFCNQFRKALGFTPGQFRSNVKEEMEKVN